MDKGDSKETRDLVKDNLKVSFQEDFHGLVADLASLIEEGRRLAVRSVNVALTATYWLMGRRIVEYEQKGTKRAEYGEALLRKLARGLSGNYGSGFSHTNLKLMRQFYLCYPISQTLSDQFEKGAVIRTLESLSENFPLSWSHYCLLLRIEEPEKRRFYETQCRQGNWSVRQLDRQIQSMLYERTALSKRKQEVLSKAHENPIILRPEDEIKDPYVLEFLNLKDEYSESDLEDALIRHLEQFLIELGVGFTFVGRQRRFEVGGRQYRIDLLLFHRMHRRLFLLDLKIGEFTHADAGQMNFYLNWAKAEARLPGENDPWGIIMCSAKNRSYVQYALGGMENKIFVSSYSLHLPKPEELERELERGRALFLEQQAVRGRQEMEDSNNDTG